MNTMDLKFRRFSKAIDQDISRSKEKISVLRSQAESSGSAQKYLREIEDYTHLIGSIKQSLTGSSVKSLKSPEITKTKVNKELEHIKVEEVKSEESE